MSAEQVKRSQYFNPPTTECPHSSRNHFEDWEEFHLPMARMHHAALHGHGVASGLAVSVQEAGAQIEVGPGVAVNGKGELIALAAEGQADVGVDRPGEPGQQIDPPFRLGTAGRESGVALPVHPVRPGAAVHRGVVRQAGADPLAAPAPDRRAMLGPIEAGEAIVLAIVEVDAEGVATVRDRPKGCRIVVSWWGRAIGELRIRRHDSGRRSGRRCAGGQDRRARRRRPAAQRGRRRRCGDPGSRGWRALLAPRGPCG